MSTTTTTSSSRSSSSSTSKRPSVPELATPKRARRLPAISPPPSPPPPSPVNTLPPPLEDGTLPMMSSESDNLMDELLNNPTQAPPAAAAEEEEVPTSTAVVVSTPPPPFSHIHNLHRLSTYYTHFNPETDLLLLPQMITVGTKKDTMGARVTNMAKRGSSVIITTPPMTVQKFWGPPYGTLDAPVGSTPYKYISQGLGGPLAVKDPKRSLFWLTLTNQAWNADSQCPREGDPYTSNDTESVIFFDWVKKLDTAFATQLYSIPLDKLPKNIIDYFIGQITSATSIEWMNIKMLAPHYPATRAELIALGGKDVDPIPTYDKFSEERRKSIRERVLTDMLKKTDSKVNKLPFTHPKDKGGDTTLCLKANVFKILNVGGIDANANAEESATTLDNRPREYNHLEVLTSEGHSIPFLSDAARLRHGDVVVARFRLKASLDMKGKCGLQPELIGYIKVETGKSSSMSFEDELKPLLLAAAAAEQEPFCVVVNPSSHTFKLTSQQLLEASKESNRGDIHMRANPEIRCILPPISDDELNQAFDLLEQQQQQQQRLLPAAAAAATAPLQIEEIQPQS